MKNRRNYKHVINTPNAMGIANVWIPQPGSITRRLLEMQLWPFLIDSETYNQFHSQWKPASVRLFNFWEEGFPMPSTNTSIYVSSTKQAKGTYAFRVTYAGGRSEIIYITVTYQMRYCHHLFDGETEVPGPYTSFAELYGDPKFEKAFTGNTVSIDLVESYYPIGSGY